jgi:hypothetical protein
MDKLAATCTRPLAVHKERKYPALAEGIQPGGIAARSSIAATASSVAMWRIRCFIAANAAVVRAARP